MIIYPAIDIRSGKCVRLYQGDYARETIYSESPYEIAEHFLEQQATWLHIVDLDGAKNPVNHQALLIQELLHNIPINIQVGGGIRTESQIEAYFAAGAKRVVIGSLAIEAPETVKSWISYYGAENIVLALDVTFRGKIPFVVTQAWKKLNDSVLFDVLNRFLECGVQHILCTDVSRDGVLKGPNHDLYQQMVSTFPTLKIQASGGISALEDIRSLKNINVSGAVLGRALYEKKFNLSQALSC